MNTRQLAKLLEAVVRKVVREELKPIIKENYQIANTSKKVKPTKKFDPLDVSHIFEENISSTNNQKSKINKKSKKVFSKNKCNFKALIIPSSSIIKALNWLI